MSAGFACWRPTSFDSAFQASPFGSPLLALKLALVRAQKEVGKKKGTPVPAPFGFPAMLDQQSTQLDLRGYRRYGIDSPTRWLTPAGQRRKLRCPKPTVLSNNARSGPLLLCASRRLQRGRWVPRESAVAPKLSEWIVPLGAAEHCSIRRKQASGCLRPQAEFPLAPPDAKRTGDRSERSGNRLRNGASFFLVTSFSTRKKKSLAQQGETVAKNHRQKNRELSTFNKLQQAIISRHSMILPQAQPSPLG